MKYLVVYFILLTVFLLFNYCSGELNHKIAVAEGEDYYA